MSGDPQEPRDDASADEGLLELAAMLDQDLHATAVAYVRALDALNDLYLTVRAFDSPWTESLGEYSQRRLDAVMLKARRTLYAAHERPVVWTPSETSSNPAVEARPPRQPGE